MGCTGRTVGAPRHQCLQLCLLWAGQIVQRRIMLSSVGHWPGCQFSGNQWEKGIWLVNIYPSTRFLQGSPTLIYAPCSLVHRPSVCPCGGAGKESLKTSRGKGENWGIRPPVCLTPTHPPHVARGTQCWGSLGLLAFSTSG